MGAVTPETCRVTLQWNKWNCILLHLVGLLFNMDLPALVAAFKCQQVPAVFLIFMYSVAYKQCILSSKNDHWRENCALLMITQNTVIMHACLVSWWFVELIMFGLSELIVPTEGLLLTTVSAWYLTLYSVHFPLLQVTWRCLYPVS